MGSVPLARDVTFLHSQGVVGVVNMCREYSGPLREYQTLGIRQLHLPTPDLHEPSLEQIQDMILFIADVLKTSSTRVSLDGSRPEHAVATRSGRIFIHCKGGRGRAVLAAVCYFVSKGLTPSDAFDMIKGKRDVAARAVLGSNLVSEFAKLHCSSN